MRNSITSSIRPFTLIGFVLLASACIPPEEGGGNQEQQTGAPAPAAVPVHPPTETHARQDSDEERLAMSPGHPANASGAAHKQQLRRAEAAYSAADMSGLEVRAIAGVDEHGRPLLEQRRFTVNQTRDPAHRRSWRR